MLPNQMLNELNNHALNSENLGGLFSCSGGVCFINGEQFTPTHEEINTLHGELMAVEHQAFNEFDSNYFYQL